MIVAAVHVIVNELCSLCSCCLVSACCPTAAAMGGRSLRYTGELVYGSSCMSGGEESADAEQLLEEAEQQWSSLVAGQASSGFFGDVGGAEAWLRLRRGLATAMRRQGR